MFPGGIAQRPKLFMTVKSVYSFKVDFDNIFAEYLNPTSWYFIWDSVVHPYIFSACITVQNKADNL